MKVLMWMFILFLIIMPVTTSADTRIDEILKRQCQYLEYVNGSIKGMDDSLLAGIVRGIGYVIPTVDQTNLYKNSDVDMIKFKACQNALKHTTIKGFESDYKFEAYKLISTK